MLKITIVNTSNERREITKGNGQLLGVVYEQKGYVHLKDEPFPKEIKVSQWADRDTGAIPEPYPKGDYQLCPSSFAVGKYGDLVCRPNLLPIQTK